MMQTLLQILSGIIAVLLLALAACGWMLRKNRTVDGNDSSWLDSKQESRRPTANGHETVDVTPSNEKQAIAEAAVRFAIEQAETQLAELPSALHSSPVSPWQQALRASSLHRNPIRK